MKQWIIIILFLTSFFPTQGFSQIKKSDSSIIKVSVGYFLNLFNLSITAQQQSPNILWWHESPHHPENLFSYLTTKNLLNPSSAQLFCGALTQLSKTARLNFYGQALEHHRIHPCFKIFTDKVSVYLNQSQSHLLNLQLFQPLTSFAFDNYLLPQSLGPSEIINVDTKNGPIYITGDLNPKEIVLTFDDGPHGLLTQKLLKILEAENLQVMFFVVGKNAQSHPSVVKFENQYGHVVANHSWSHPDMRKLPKNEAKDQIFNTFDLISNIIGQAPSFFRFPFGAYNKTQKLYLKSRDISSFFWNMDTLDWKINDPEKLLNHVISEVEREGRGIILFHDIHPQTIAIMPAFLEYLKQNNYKPFVFKQVL